MSVQSVTSLSHSLHPTRIHIFFRHLPGGDCPNSQGESLEHEQLKMEVYRLCQKLGNLNTVYF